MLYPWKDKIANHKFVTWKQPFCSKSSHEDDLKIKMIADTSIWVTPLRLYWLWKDAYLIGLQPTETFLKGSDLDWLKPTCSISRSGVRPKNLHFSQETLLWLIFGDHSLKSCSLRITSAQILLPSQISSDNGQIHNLLSSIRVSPKFGNFLLGVYSLLPTCQ